MAFGNTATGGQTMRVDVRVIAATNKNLLEEVAKGRFREDLFYRLNVVALEMPPLRERKSDIPALAKFFVDRYATENGKPVDSIAPEAIDLLAAYDWPGNVRELENAIERAVVMAPGNVIEARHLPAAVKPSTHLEGGAPPIPGSTLAEIEKYAILETLKATGGSTSKAAEMLTKRIRSADAAAFERLKKKMTVHEPTAAEKAEWKAVFKKACQNLKSAIPGDALGKVGAC